MRFISVRGESPPVGFRTTVYDGIAPDGGLYVPDRLPPLPKNLFDDHEQHSLTSIGALIASSFIDDIPQSEIARIAKEAWNFPIPLVPLDKHITLLELFHGPTLTFKDVGARFMARVLSYYLQEQANNVTILVATSGDTGSAVAHGYYNVPNISVYILYPSGKISRLQEQHMTTLGGNIHAIEVEGTFDDCQALVKRSLGDNQLRSGRSITTANSINLARLLPQITYYVWAFVQWRKDHHRGSSYPAVVVPSGNFGNLTAAAYARSMGTPMAGLIAATNANDVVSEYLKKGTFVPRPSYQTLSNAMDVGDPSNFSRLQHLYNNDVEKFRKEIVAYSVTDDETLDEIRKTYEATTYVLDPHTAVGVRAARRALKRTPGAHPMIVAATAHPGKFPEVIQRALGISIPTPPSLEESLRRPKLSTKIPADYETLKKLLCT